MVVLLHYNFLQCFDTIYVLIYIFSHLYSHLLYCKSKKINDNKSTHLEVQGKTVWLLSTQITFQCFDGNQRRCAWPRRSVACTAATSAAHRSFVAWPYLAKVSFSRQTSQAGSDWNSIINITRQPCFSNVCRSTHFVAVCSVRLISSTGPQSL